MMAVDKLVDSAQLNTDLTAVANAIRAKSGGSTPLAFPGGFVSEIGSIQTGGGDSSLLNSLIDGTITSINYSGSTIRNHAFNGCEQLETISAPDVTSIGGNAFNGCAKLKNPVFPKATTIGNGAFSSSGIEELTPTNFPLITLFGSSMFQSCSKLARVFLPDVTLGQQAFSQCTSLKTAVFKAFTYNTQFNVCSALKAVDKTGDGAVAATAFNSCRALTTLVLRSGTLCALSNTSAFGGTPFASGGAGGTLYVPQALVSQYTQATNWSTVLGYANNQILPIEGSIYETQYADGTPIT